jgi:DNA-binding transcriptional MerR regulator
MESLSSASSTVEGSAAAQVPQSFAFNADGRPRLMRPPRSGSPASAQQVTAVEAWAVVNVRPATIRQWVARGYLRRVGTRGRAALYDRDDLRRVRLRTHDRTKTVPLLPVLDLSPKYDDSFITVVEAANFLGVAPSTVRSWVTRGRLRPSGQSGRAHLFTVHSVLVASWRSRHDS